ncbi:MAG TPA: type II 3-dehydroquinate dehydratase [Bacteroidales bacterium]|nr:type II 3-dehydroquinate dehydratase [Bacteroidales bacterium]HPR58969.1 type II 3-dehydroquinate dehydratase [Bacteroidales bacterium]HRW97664.1 type II 3-dehydroquinate dehydratase [Bacteroidales bacterium]
MKIQIINGPNLNLTGIREKEIYGNETFEHLLEQLRRLFPEYTIDYFQSNIEGEIINKLHEAGFSYDGIILNAGGYTHTSVAIGDAVKAISAPVVEVHISNVFAREPYRHVSYVAPFAFGSVIGFGPDGYRLAVLSLIKSGNV